MNDIEFQKALHEYAQAYVDFTADESWASKNKLDAATRHYGQVSREYMIGIAWQNVVHPWDETLDWNEDNIVTGDGWCNLCWYPDGDARCLRCGHSVGGPFSCSCDDKQVIGPCVEKDIHTK